MTPALAQALTQDCPQQTCALQSGTAAVTLVGTIPVWDRNGNMTVQIAPNTITTPWTCNTCGSQWSVAVQGDSQTITKTK